MVYPIKEYIFAPKIKVKNGQEHTFTFISPSHWSLAQQARNGGVTQTQLAELLKVNQAFISKIETCERRLDIIELHHICQVLGISFVDFIQEVDRDILCKREEESYITIKDFKKIRYGKN